MDCLGKSSYSLASSKNSCVNLSKYSSSRTVSRTSSPIPLLKLPSMTISRVSMQWLLVSLFHKQSSLFLIKKNLPQYGEILRYHSSMNLSELFEILFGIQDSFPFETGSHLEWCHRILHASATQILAFLNISPTLFMRQSHVRCDFDNKFCGNFLLLAAFPFFSFEVFASYYCHPFDDRFVSFRSFHSILHFFISLLRKCFCFYLLYIFPSE